MSNAVPEHPRKPPRPKLCVYCGQRPAVKMDHVIGKVFFDELPSNMITVPSCNECDSGTGDGGTISLHHDEEYMRNVLCMREDVAENHPVAMKLMESKVIGSFENSAKLARSLLKTTKLVNLRTPEGIYWPTPRQSYDVDKNRIRRVIRKIVRGLNYHRVGKPLAFDAVIEVTPDLKERDFDMFHAFMKNELWFGYDNKVFMYKSAWFPDRPEHAMWLMIFYRTFAVLAMTMTPEDSERHKRLRAERRKK